MKKKKQVRQRSAWESLKERYHLSVVNKSLLVEVYSRDISRGRLIAAVLSMAFLLVGLTYCVIAFTPIKSKIIPGYESETARMELYELQGRLLKLQQQVNGKMEYSLRLDSNLNKFGIPVDSINNMSLKKLSLQSDKQPALPDKFINLAQASEASVLAYYHFL